MSIIAYNGFRLVFGTLYPAYASYKAIKTRSNKEYLKWMMYWIVMAFFSCAETVADTFIAWFPFYYELKILFVLWLLSPATKGSTIIYRKIVHPQLAKRETEIDSYIQKASDQGYSAVLSLGSKGFSYVTNAAVSTAIMGQAKIADQLRKSYSMNDLSGDKLDGNPMAMSQFRMKEYDEMSIDDEQDNRLIQEEYQRDLMEKEGRSSHNARTNLRNRSNSLHDNPDNDSLDGESIHEEEEILEEESLLQSKNKKPATYTHKEAYHYGTLPRTKTRTRASVKNM